MSLRRFQNLQIGALTAQRMNELVDAVTRLQQRIDMMPPIRELSRESIVVRFDDSGTKLSGSCSGSINAVSYRFTEIMIESSTQGDIGSESCVSFGVSGSRMSDDNATLLVFEEEPSYKLGDCAMAHFAAVWPRASSDKQLVFVASPKSKTNTGAVELASVGGGSGGIYNCSILRTGESVMVANLYETNGYYGALEAEIECAIITPNQNGIPPGSVIPAFLAAGNEGSDPSWVTVIPTPFDASCICNTEGIQALENAEERDIESRSGKGGIAAHFITRIMGI